MVQVLQKYILVAFIVGAVLKYSQTLRISDTQLAYLIIGSTAIVFCIDCFFNNNTENMMNIDESLNMDEDEVNTTLRYTHGMPMYPLLQDGGFTADLRGNKIGSVLTKNQLPGEICNSKMNDLVDQHNHNQWTPHTHVGKNRGYLNW
jgi:uncharacterized membrane protein